MFYNKTTTKRNQPSSEVSAEIHGCLQSFTVVRFSVLLPYLTLNDATCYYYVLTDSTTVITCAFVKLLHNPKINLTDNIKNDTAQTVTGLQKLCYFTPCVKEIFGFE